MSSATPSESADEAQADAVAKLGPQQPRCMDTMPEPALGMSMGTVNGLTLRAFFSFTT